METEVLSEIVDYVPVLDTSKSARTPHQRRYYFQSLLRFFIRICSKTEKITLLLRYSDKKIRVNGAHVPKVD